MEWWIGLPSQTRWLIAAALGIVAALAFCLSVGAALFAINRNPQSAETAAPPSATADAVSSTATLSGSFTHQPSTTVPEASASVTSTATPSPTASPSPPPPTRTPIPPTAPPTPTPYVDLVCIELTHEGATTDGVQQWTATYRNQGTAPTEHAGFEFAFQITNPEGSSLVHDDLGVELSYGEEDFTAFADQSNFSSLPGKYTAEFIADFSNDVEESDETNNSCQITYSLLPFGLTLVPATLVP